MRISILFGIMLLACSNILAQSPFDQKQKQDYNPNSNHEFQLIDGQTNHTHRQYQQRYQSQPFVQSKPVLKDLNIKRANDTGMPIFIEGYKSQKDFVGKSANVINEAAFDFLTEVKEELCLINPREEFTILFSEKDAQDYQHIKLQQTYEGLPIYASELIVHAQSNGKMSINGRHQPTPDLETTTPTISAEQAAEIVTNHHATDHPYRELTDTEKEMLSYEGPQTELILYPSREVFGHFHLAYHITLRPNFMQRFEYFIDAHTGEFLNHYDHTCSINGPATATAQDLNGVNQIINTYEYQNNFYLYDASRDMYTGPQSGLPMPGDGGIETLDFQNNSFQQPSYADIKTSNNVWTTANHRKGVSAHHNAGECYEYFKNTHGRNSINGQGGDIVSFINVADEYGNDFDNAFWNGQYMFYGNGKNAFYPLAGALDVAGHEMCHGVIQSTANLEYQGESGAINESMADVFGVMIDRDDWDLGEDIVQPGVYPNDALRSMSDPHNGANTGDYGGGWQPSNTNEQYTGSADNGGVHINSGIPNNAFYRIAIATSKEKAEAIYYKALTSYLTRSSQFIDLRLAVISAAQNLGYNGDLNAIATAFNQVGILDGNGGNYEEEIEENTGDEFILSLDVNSGDPNTLYVSDVAGTNFLPLTTNTVNRKPSMTDDGQDIYYVGEDNKVYNINLALANGDLGSLSPQETQVSALNGLTWDNVAVSKNGKRLALISTFIDTAIYVYDIPTQEVAKFRLYNPTFSSGVNAGGVLYADAIEWDYTGQYILYDAYNVIDNPLAGEVDIDYWDMGVLHAWNNDGEDFAEGDITKLFSNLPEGVSIGNPTFTKNSPYIIAFDYLNTPEAETILKGANLETGTVEDIYNNNSLAYASYATDDSKIVFSSLDGTEEVVKSINLQSSKIEASSGASTIIGVAKWPIWFAQGQRDLPTSVTEVKNITENLQVTPNPFSENLVVNFNLKETTDLQVSVFTITGQMIRSSLAQTYTAGSHQIQFETTDLAAGSYIVHLRNNEQTQSLKVVKF